MTTAIPDLPALLWAAAALSVAIAALLQRLTGQGFGMVAAPLLALILPQMLPTILLVLGAVVGFRAMRADPGAIMLSELPPGMAGRALGAVVAAWFAGAVIGSPVLGIVIAGVVFAAIALSLSGLRVAIRPASLFAAGTVAGLMGTLTAIGAPPMALLYQHEAQRRSATMQNTFFMFGMVVSLGALAWQGLVRWDQVVTAALLAPAAFAGLALATPLAARMRGMRARPIALGLAGTSAAILLIRSVLAL